MCGVRELRLCLYSSARLLFPLPSSHTFLDWSTLSRYEVRNRASSERGQRMQGIRIEFEWFKFIDYGVEVRPGVPGSLLSQVNTELLVGLGPREAALKTRPLDMSPDLYLELAKSQPTLAGYKEFAKRYGLLTDPQRDYTYQWPQLIMNMRNLIDLIRDTGNWKIEGEKYVPFDLKMKFGLRFVPTSADGSQTALSIVPANLYNALVLQCVSNRAGGGEVRSCKACGALFETGRTTGRRSNREFCSDKCRFEFSHRNRRKKQ